MKKITFNKGENFDEFFTLNNYLIFGICWHKVRKTVLRRPKKMKTGHNQ